AVFVISPTRVINLVDYSSSSDSDPSKDSLPVALKLPLYSPFLCFDDSKADSESEPAEQIPERHESLTPSFEFQLSHVLAPLGIHQRPAILIRPESSPDSSSKRSLDSSLSSAGPSRKRCKSPATLVPSSTPVLRSIAPALADLLPYKRFKDSYSSKASGEDHMEICTADAKTVVDLGIIDGVGAHTKDGIGDSLDLEGTLYDISHYMSKVPLERIIEFETA
nr:hypothetical protein [Tanacetum cinerariifolium]GFB12103.1 hypothetical protein [Tanacetum cinerariifolium]GFB12142.1 hypothetical protein [Tanacetum cinerariifolium]